MDMCVSHAKALLLGHSMNSFFTLKLELDLRTIIAVNYRHNLQEERPIAQHARRGFALST